jgi:hypothetical protein
MAQTPNGHEGVCIPDAVVGGPWYEGDKLFIAEGGLTVHAGLQPTTAAISQSNPAPLVQLESRKNNFPEHIVVEVRLYSKKNG